MSLTLESIFDSKRFEEKSLKQPKWLKSGRLSFIDHWPGSEKDTVWTYDPELDRKEPLFDPAVLKLYGSDKPLDVHGVIWSPDETRLYAASGLSGTLTIIDLRAGKVIDTVKLGGRPWGAIAAPK